MAEKKMSVYASIAEDILKKIKLGTYPVGSLLPPERELMDIYKVQRTTVRRGLDILSSQGYIRKAAGLGSVVESKTPVPVYTDNAGTRVNLTVIKADKASDSAKLSVVLPTKNTDSLPKCIVNTVAEMGSVYITDDISDAEKDSTVIVMANADTDTSEDCCLAFCQSDEKRSVMLDSDKAAYTALTYLENLGHKSFAYIGTDTSFSFENAFYDSFSAVNSFFDEELINLSGSNEKAGFDGFSELFRRHGGKFTAVCTVNDEVARGVIKAAKYYKISVPDELSVISLCSCDKKSGIDSVYFDTKALADEIIDSARVCHRISTVLFGGALNVSGTSSDVRSGSNQSTKISSFLL